MFKTTAFTENTENYTGGNKPRKIILTANEESEEAIGCKQKKISIPFLPQLSSESSQLGISWRKLPKPLIPCRRQLELDLLINKNLYHRTSDTWTSQTEEECPPFYTWKISNELTQTTRLITETFIPTLRTPRFKEAVFLLCSSELWTEQQTCKQPPSDRHPCH